MGWSYWIRQIQCSLLFSTRGVSAVFRPAEKCKSCGSSYQRTELGVDPFGLSCGWISGEDCFACTVANISCDPGQELLNASTVRDHANINSALAGGGILVRAQTWPWVHAHLPQRSPSSHTPFIPLSTTIPTLPAAFCRPGSSTFHVSHHRGGWMVITENIKNNYLLIRKWNKPLHKLNAHK